MRNSVERVGSWLVAACLVATLSCNNSDFLEPGNELLDIHGVANNQPASGFECVVFEVSTFTVRPTDPDANATLNDSVSLLSGTFVTQSINISGENCNLTPTNDFGDLVLPTGRYRILSLVVTSIALSDLDGSPPTFVSCGLSNFDLADLYPAEQREFVVRPGEPNQLTLDFDVQAAVAAWTPSGCVAQDIDDVLQIR